MDEGYGFIDKNGDMVIKPKFYAYRGGYEEFKDGYASPYILGKDKWGLLDKKGNEILPFKYENRPSYSEGMILIREPGKSGFMDFNGNIKVPMIFDDAYNYSEGLAAVEKNEKWGYVNKKGDEIIPLIYEDASDFSEGLARVKKNGKWGYVDKKGKSTFDYQ